MQHNVADSRYFTFSTLYQTYFNMTSNINKENKVTKNIVTNS